MRVRMFLTATTTAVTAAAVALGVTPSAGADTQDDATLTVKAFDSTGAAVTPEFHTLMYGEDPEFFLDGPDKGTTSLGDGPGTYAVSVTIREAGRTTIGFQRVEVGEGEDVTVEFDARDGDPITVAVTDDPAAKLVRIEAAPNRGGWNLGGAVATGPGRMFVIPEAGKDDVSLYVHAAFDGGGGSARPIRYDVVHTSEGLPENPAFTDSRSALARVDMALGRLDARELPTMVDLTPDADGAHGIELDAGKGARELVSYRTPNIWWYASVAANGASTYADIRKYSPGKHAEAWGLAVWGPLAGSYASVAGKKLSVFRGFPICPAPRFPEQNECVLSDSRETFQLYRGTKLLKQLSGGPADMKDLTTSLGTTATRYTFKATTTLSRPGTLSSKVTSAWTFNARALSAHKSADIPLGVVSFRPDGLDARVGAKPGSTTKLPVRVWTRSAAVKTFTLESSSDGGKTWHAVKITKTTNQTWQAKVANPGKAGYMSLRAKVSDAAGNSFVQTIIRAYKVG